jgi:aspartyl/asparaginyl-tRNA synthetase
VASQPFKRITYTEAIELLKKSVAEGKKFEYEVRSEAGCKSKGGR